MDFNTIFFKIRFLSLLFLFSYSAWATDYYVDAINGNDGNSGSSEAQAWKTLSKVQSASSGFGPGDIIAFKRGQTFKGALNYAGASGTANDPVIFTAYGTGERPVLTAFGTLTGTWTNHGNNKWSLPVTVTVTRLYKDGVEIKKTSPVEFGHTWEEFGSVAVWIWDNNRLYLYSTTNPSSSRIEGNTLWGVITLTNKSYIDIEQLDLRGGTNSVIKLTESSHIDIRDCAIGKQAGYGIVIGDSNNILIERNSFDADFTLKFTGVESYRGTDARGVNDAIASWGGLTDSEIRYNDFINWGHAAIGWTSYGAAISGNKVHHNLITAPDLIYARAFGYSGNGVNNNEIYNNYVYKTSIRSQINGKNNHVHHNWIDDVINSPLKTGEQGQAFAYENYNGNPTGNIFEYNTVSNTDGPGIELVASGSSATDISGNTIRKNKFINCGRKAYYPRGKGKGIYIQNYVDIRANNFYDNAFSSPLTSNTIYHRDAEVSPPTFNSRNSTSIDSISGNTATATDQGAGTLDLSTIGVGTD